MIETSYFKRTERGTMEKIILDSPKSGSELVLETLRDLGIDTIFGYPGGAVLPLYDAIYSFKGIRHILGRHEQGCLHEAEGYAKSTGKLGVAVVTSGPGATNAITGIAFLFWFLQVKWQERVLVRMLSRKQTLSVLPCQLPSTTIRLERQRIFHVLLQRLYILRLQVVRGQLLLIYQKMFLHSRQILSIHQK